MVSNPTQMLQAELNRVREENATLRADTSSLRSFMQALQTLVDVEEKTLAGESPLLALTEMVQQALDLLAASDGSLLLLDHETGELEFVVVQGSARQLVGQRLKPREGIAGWVAANGKLCVVRDVRTDPRFSARMDQMIGYRTQSIAAVPLIGNRRTFGVLEVVNKPGDEPFDELDQTLLLLYGRFVGEVLANIDEASREQDIIRPPDYEVGPAAPGDDAG